ncbi:MAG: hypothetical protein HY314_04150 [Acidobacteria bacterium]|nr:hypothetical protein [Acidobacteriota bacterium]
MPSPDSKIYAFVATGEQDGRPISTLYTIQEDGERLTRVTQSQPAGPEGEGGFAGFGGGISSLQFSKDGRTIFFMERNGIYAIDIGGGGGGGAQAQAQSQTQSPAPAAQPSSPGRASERRRINFTARVEADHRIEWKQVFNESWRVMKNRFYDPKMHGVDWAKMKLRLRQDQHRRLHPRY